MKSMPPQPQNEKKEPVIPDKGHELLVSDLEALLKEAQSFAFHDFKNTDYATPKVVLVTKLHDLAEKVQNGEYDN